MNDQACDHSKETAEEMEQMMQEAISKMEQLVDAQEDMPGQSGGNPVVGPNGNYEGEVVIDGETPYLNVLDEYAEIIRAYLSGEQDIPDELRLLIQNYLEMIS